MKSNLLLLCLILPIFSGCISIEKVDERLSQYRRAPNFDGVYYLPQDLDKEVVIVESKEPIPPTNWRDSSKSCWARVELIVDEKGNPTQIQSVEATDSQAAMAAERCLRGWTFIPGVKDGTEVKSHLLVELDFATRMNRLRNLKLKTFRDPHRGPPAQVPLY